MPDVMEIRGMAIVASNLIVTLIGGHANAQERSAAGSAVLTPPSGWVRSEADGVARYSPREDPDAASMHLTPGEELHGAVDRWFDERWRQILGRVTPLETRPIDAGRTSSGLSWRIAMAALDVNGGEPFAVVLLAVSDGSRVQPVVVTFRDSEALNRYGPAAERAYNQIALLPPADRPPARLVDLAALVVHRQVTADPRASPARPPAADQSLANPPGRLRGTSWRVVNYATEAHLDGRTSGMVTVYQELFLSADGSYEHREATGGGGRLIERGSYDVRGDQLVLRGSQAHVTRAGRQDEPRQPRTRTYSWHMAHDPEIEDLGRRVPAMRLSCPGSPHCFTVLVLRDESGRAEMWRVYD